MTLLSLTSSGPCMRVLNYHTSSHKFFSAFNSSSPVFLTSFHFLHHPRSTSLEQESVLSFLLLINHFSSLRSAMWSVSHIPLAMCVLFTKLTGNGSSTEAAMIDGRTMHTGHWPLSCCMRFSAIALVNVYVFGRFSRCSKWGVMAASSSSFINLQLQTLGLRQWKTNLNKQWPIGLSLSERSM